MNIPRILDLRSQLDQKSCFLFGPRQTGKSWMIRHTLSDALVYDLLNHATYTALSREPALMEQEWEARKRSHFIVIDEIQRLPFLLNEVHRLIERHGLRFLLTGSSARKLRRGGVNLLGGRARILSLNPFVSAELGERFEIDKALNRGLLPSLWFSDSPDADLAAYVGTYLREEVAAEALVRNVPAFSRFLQVAAVCNGQMIQHTRIANDAQVPRTTVAEYFEILKDTLTGHELPAWRASVKRKALSTSKFYLFDCGVVRHLQGRREIVPGTPEYGSMLETLLFHELRAWANYRGGIDLRYWRSTSGFEVDFLVGERLAVEVKASARPAGSDLKGLRALREELPGLACVCVHTGPTPREVDGILLLPVREFLARLWGGGLISAI